MSTLDREDEFAACLLVVGPPDFIEVTGHEHQVFVEGGINTRVFYRNQCVDWRSANGSDKTSLKRWYIEYKQWLWDNGYGQQD